VRYLSISIALFGLAGLCGCGGGGGASIPALGTVTGKVTVGGQPLANAVVTFTPASGRPSAGTTGSDGTYKLMYNVDNAGATIGEHTVLVSAGDDSGDYEGDGEDEGDEDEGELPEVCRPLHQMAPSKRTCRQGPTRSISSCRIRWIERTHWQSQWHITRMFESGKAVRIVCDVK